MMENHSYDNRLGMPFRPGADGFRLGKGGPPTATNPYPNGHGDWQQEDQPFCYSLYRQFPTPAS
jgi:hypothetical protein